MAARLFLCPWGCIVVAHLNWFRWYVGSVSDPKLTLVARRAKQKRVAVIAVWATLLEAAASENNGGAFRMPSDEIALVLEMKVEQVNEILSKMEERGLISNSRVTNWEKRQYASDCSTTRVKKHRAAIQALEGNVSETFQERSGNVAETEVKRLDQIRGEQRRTEESRGREETPARAQEDEFDSIGFDAHLLAPEAAVWRDLVHDVSPRIPRNAQGKPSLRSWGIALAEVCVPGSNYPLSREEIEQALRDDPPDVTKWPERWLAYHADRARAERNRRRRAEAAPEPSAAELRAEAARQRAREESKAFFDMIGRNPDGSIP